MDAAERSYRETETVATRAALFALMIGDEPEFKDWDLDRVAKLCVRVAWHSFLAEPSTAEDLEHLGK